MIAAEQQKWIGGLPQKWCSSLKGYRICQWLNFAINRYHFYPLEECKSQIKGLWNPTGHFTLNSFGILQQINGGDTWLRALWIIITKRYSTIVKQKLRRLIKAYLCTVGKFRREWQSWLTGILSLYYTGLQKFYSFIKWFKKY